MTDRIAIRELIDAYAHWADRRDAEGQISLLSEDTEFLVFKEGWSMVLSPTQIAGGLDQYTAEGMNLRALEVGKRSFLKTRREQQ